MDDLSKKLCLVISLILASILFFALGAIVYTSNSSDSTDYIFSFVIASLFCIAGLVQIYIMRKELCYERCGILTEDAGADSEVWG